MEGHTEAEETKEEEVYHKLSRRASFIDPAHLAALAQHAPEPSEPETMSEDSREEEDEVNQKSSISNKGGETTAKLDPAITELLYTMNKRLTDLAGTVDNLASRVDNMAGVAEQPVMMVPQRIRMTMNKQIESIQQSVGGIGDTVDMIANRANSPILMVPHYGDGDEE